MHMPLPSLCSYMHGRVFIVFAMFRVMSPSTSRRACVLATASAYSLATIPRCPGRYMVTTSPTLLRIEHISSSMAPLDVLRPVTAVGRLHASSIRCTCSADMQSLSMSIRRSCIGVPLIYSGSAATFLM